MAYCAGKTSARYANVLLTVTGKNVTGAVKVLKRLSEALKALLQ